MERWECVLLHKTKRSNYSLISFSSHPSIPAPSPISLSLSLFLSFPTLHPAPCNGHHFDKLSVNIWRCLKARCSVLWRQIFCEEEVILMVLMALSSLWQFDITLLTTLMFALYTWSELNCSCCFIGFQEAVAFWIPSMPEKLWHWSGKTNSILSYVTH